MSMFWESMIKILIALMSLVASNAYAVELNFSFHCTGSSLLCDGCPADAFYSLNGVKGETDVTLTFQKISPGAFDGPQIINEYPVYSSSGSSVQFSTKGSIYTLEIVSGEGWIGRPMAGRPGRLIKKFGVCTYGD